MAEPIFHGVIPPLVTPLTDDRDIDEASLRSLVEYLIAAGVHGVFALGSSGESSGLTVDQRNRVAEIVVDAVAGRVPVLAGVIEPGTTSVIERARAVQALGVNGIVVTPPFYVHASDAEIIEHFRAVHTAVDLPIMAYNIPTNMLAKLDRKVVTTLATEATIAGVKDSGRNDANFRQCVMDVRDVPGFATFTGSEVTVDFALFAGAAGCVSGLANVDPAGYVRLYDAMLAHRYDHARAEQERLCRLGAIRTQATRRETGGTASSIGGYKTALQHLGVIATNQVALPITRLDPEEAERVANVLTSCELGA